MNILLVNPPMPLEADFIDYPYFANLGMLQHAAVLESRGHTVLTADAFAAKESDAYPAEAGRLLAGCRIQTLLSPFRRHDFDAVVLCLSVFHKPFIKHPVTAGAVKMLRDMFPRAVLIAVDAYFGGMHYIGYAPETFFRNYPAVDFLIQGESEITLARILESPDLAGAFPRAQAGDSRDVLLDTLPQPAWHLIRMNLYWDFLSRFFHSTGRYEDFKGTRRVLPILTSRGCRYNCSFCCQTAGGRRVRYRVYSLEYLHDYLKHLKARHRLEGIVILDGLANGDGFMQRLELIESLSLKVFFINGLRADLLRPAHIRKLSHITPSLTVSAESASARVRNEILRKQLSLESVEQTAARCRKNRLPLRIHYMVGVPGETPRETNATLEHACKMAEDFGAEPLLQMCVPLPGTSLHAAHAQLLPAPAAPEEITYASFSPKSIGRDETRHSEFLQKAMRAYLLRQDNRRPKRLILNLTYHCNNHCEICAVGGRPVRHLPMARCLRLLSEYYGLGVRNADFDGGEPTLHPEFLKLLRAARNMGYEGINVSTNGRTMASRELASRLLLGGVTGVLITLYGHTAEIHEKTTQVPGSFDETLQGIRNTLRLKPDRIAFGVNTVVTKHNYRQMETFMDFLRVLGVPRLNVQFLTPFGHAGKAHCPPMEAASARLSAALLQSSGGLEVRILNLPPCRMPEHEDSVLADAGKYGRHMAFVNAPPENLGKYLSRRRARRGECEDCAFRIVCGGFYDFSRSGESKTSG